MKRIKTAKATKNDEPIVGCILIDHSYRFGHDGKFHFVGHVPVDERADYLQRLLRELRALRGKR